MLLDNADILLDEENFIQNLDESFIEPESIENQFLYLRKSSFISFFIDNMIDVPICFKKSNSLRTKNFELPLLKFTNYLMRQGKRDKATSVFFQALRFFIKNLKTEVIQIDKNSQS
jgi:hypothetical protein